MQINGALADLRALVARYGTLDPSLPHRGAAPGTDSGAVPHTDAGSARAAGAGRLPDDDGRGWSFPLPALASPRHSAVLVLFGALDRRPAQHHVTAVPEELDLLLTQRSLSLRKHPGQVAFPGGGHDTDDADLTATALREAQEETGLDPAGVRVVGTLPPAPLAVSNFNVTPVIGWWDRPSDVFVVDEGEATRVFRVPVADLVDPANRVTTARAAEPSVGPRRFTSPGFVVADTLVWGFTAILLDRMLKLLGWAQPWDTARILDVTGWDATQPVPAFEAE